VVGIIIHGASITIMDTEDTVSEVIMDMVASVMEVIMVTVVTADMVIIMVTVDMEVITDMEDMVDTEAIGVVHIVIINQIQIMMKQSDEVLQQMEPVV